MKRKHVWLALILAVALLGGSTCLEKSDDGGGGGGADDPNFIQEGCPGCVTDEQLSSGGAVSGYRFYSYVKNIGGTGKISMTISAGSNSATSVFDVTAGTSYVFTASVSVEASGTSSFTYMARFPGTAGYTDSHTVNGYRVTGGPANLTLTQR